MTGVTAGARQCLAFDRDEPSTGAEDSACLVEAGVDVGPVMHAGDRPRDRRGIVRHGQCLGGALEVPHRFALFREQAGDSQHDGRRIDAGHACAETSGMAGRDTWTAPDVHHHIVGCDATEPYGEPRVAVAAHDHAERGDEPSQTREPGIARMVIGNGGAFGHTLTLTVEPDFKSSGNVSEPLLTIGEVAQRAHVATSTVRYYERRGLLAADARVSGQRRYRLATLRRLVFIGMLRDAGLALEDIGGILNAATVGEWKAIAAQRLDLLDEQIAGLTQARAYLAGALLCRYDHPATDCMIMGTEIDRRLADTDRAEERRTAASYPEAPVR